MTHTGPNQILPWCMVMDFPSRDEMAKHLRALRKIDRKHAIKAVHEAIWIGTYPLKRDKL